METESKDQETGNKSENQETASESKDQKTESTTKTRWPTWTDLWTSFGKVAVALAALYYGYQLLGSILATHPELIARCFLVSGETATPTSEEWGERYKKLWDDVRVREKKITGQMQEAQRLASVEVLEKRLLGERRRDGVKVRAISELSSDFLRVMNELEKVLKEPIGSTAPAFFDLMGSSFGKGFGLFSRTSGLTICNIENRGGQAAAEVRLEFTRPPHYIVISSSGDREAQSLAKPGKILPLGALGAEDKVEVRIWSKADNLSFKKAPFQLFYAGGVGTIDVGVTLYGWKAWLAKRTGGDLLVAAGVLVAIFGMILSLLVRRRE